MGGAIPGRIIICAGIIGGGTMEGMPPGTALIPGCICCAAGVRALFSKPEDGAPVSKLHDTIVSPLNTNSPRGLRATGFSVPSAFLPFFTRLNSSASAMTKFMYLS